MSQNIGKATIKCKGRFVLGEKPWNMLYSMVLYISPFLPFNWLKSHVILLYIYL
jgi:hypothetical protein